MPNGWPLRLQPCPFEAQQLTPLGGITTVLHANENLTDEPGSWWGAAHQWSELEGTSQKTPGPGTAGTLPMVGMPSGAAPYPCSACSLPDKDTRPVNTLECGCGRFFPGPSGPKILCLADQPTVVKRALHHGLQPSESRSRSFLDHMDLPPVRPK